MYTDLANLRQFAKIICLKTTTVVKSAGLLNGHMGIYISQCKVLPMYAMLRRCGNSHVQIIFQFGRATQRD